MIDKCMTETISMTLNLNKRIQTERQENAELKS